MLTSYKQVAPEVVLECGQELREGSLISLCQLLALQSGWTKLSSPLQVGCKAELGNVSLILICLLYTSPSPRDRQKSRMPSSA